ncbi:MAG: hypothetical protein KDB70_18605 [Mycobacterium sp.]|nr:hypothetical protein [Mycobacterium sp.]
MADHLADLHPLLLRGLRTGLVPSCAEIAEATGKTVAEVERILAAPDDDETDDADAESEDPDAQRFRDRYHRLVAERCAEWLEENVTLDNRVPAAVRADIEYACNGQIQREWRAHRAALRGDED